MMRRHRTAARAGRRPARRPAGLLAALALAVTAAGGAIQPLSLFEKTARAPLVVYGEVTDGTHRFAVIRAIEVMRCGIPECPGDTFRIAFRLDSFLRRPWQDKIEFATGERLLLFLRKFTKEDGEKPEGDIYTLMWGAQGRLSLPPEGAEATVSAARAFVAIQLTRDFDRQARMLREAAADRNPVTAEGALEELIEQRLGDPEMIPFLTDLLGHTRETTRVLGLRLMRQILADARAADRVIEGRDGLADLLRGRAALDPSAPFRVEAVRVLEVLGGEEVKAFLASLAKGDPSQEVRYEAEKALLGWRGGP